MSHYMSEWEEYLSSSGRLFYYNSRTGKSQWTDPSDDKIPPEKKWRQVSDEDGRLYYFNTATQESVWIKPEQYSDDYDMNERIKQERQDFFIMLSSSVPKDINPLEHISQRTPALYTMAELSSRFDTDMRLINTPQVRRERYLDEWITLERKRRVILEKKMISKTQEDVKQKLLQMYQQEKISAKTKWDEIIIIMKQDKDWQNLLNIDRIRVFTDVMNIVYEEYENRIKDDREKITAFQAENRISFERAMREKLETYGSKLLNSTYKEFQNEIESLPEYQLIIKNNGGSSAEDLFYDLIDEKQVEFEEKFLKNTTISSEEEITDPNVFFQKHRELDSLDDNEKQYAYTFVVKKYLVNKFNLTQKYSKSAKNIMKLYKLVPQLVKCSNYYAAKELLRNNPVFCEIDSDELKEQIFQDFVKWGENRDCEPGEILPEDSDWEDISEYFK